MIGASGPLGKRVTARLLERGCDVLALSRSEARLAGLCAPGKVADAADPVSLAAALKDAGALVCCGPAGYTAQILAALPEHFGRVVITGSTRRFTRFPDPRALDLIRLETLLQRSWRDVALVHPSMILGTENNAPRVAAYIRRFGAVPLPGGGEALIQPIHADDVAAALVAALLRPERPWPPVIAAGPAPVTYRAFIEAIARAICLPVRIVPVPAALLMTAAPLTRLVPGLPAIAAPEVRRLLEDKAFPIDRMRGELGVEPVGLEEALGRVFG